MSLVRNYCIIAHIDHGKSTLADRFIELTGTVAKDKIRDQMLDSMELERERGITIKLQPVHMIYRQDGLTYELNLIDTPGHVDFAYEVSRSLAAVEGAVLLVDAVSGVQAQTMANLSLARERDLTIIPVVNKIDLPTAEPDRARQELATLVACDPASVILASGRTGAGVAEIIRRIISDVPSPPELTDQPLRALVFDSIYNPYRGVVVYVRIMEGRLRSGDAAIAMASGQRFVAEEVGVLSPGQRPVGELSAGDIGYVVTGFKRVADCRVGDTVTLLSDSAETPLAGYSQPQPMIYASFFRADGDMAVLRVALEKLAANDAALAFDPYVSEAFGAGFRMGFLGLLHLEITKARLEREYGLDLIVTTPVVAIQGTAKDGYREPWVMGEIVTPQRHVGSMMALIEQSRGIFRAFDYLEPGSKAGGQDSTVILHCELPLADIIIDFNDRLKSLSGGYATFAYTFLEYRAGSMVELTVVIAGEIAKPFSQLVPAKQAETKGRALVKRLKQLIPRQMFEVSLQAVVDGKIIGREDIPALRKDVTAKLYGGDFSRKRKLLEKQKEGKRRMKQFGRVSIPTDVFLLALKPSDR